MAKYIHNISEEAKTYEGREVAASAFFLIEPYTEAEYMSCAQLISDLANGIVKMSANGSSDITGGGSAQVDFLKSIDTTPKDSDGSPLSRAKVTQTGWNYQLHGIEFKTCQLDSIYSKSHDNSINGTDVGFATLKVFKDNGSGVLTECSDQTDADANGIATQLDFEATHDIEIIGGMLKQLTLTNQDLRVWVIGVPDVPTIAGGSKAFAVNINLKFIPVAEGIRVDGRAPKKLAYDANYHTNKIRIFLRHAAGFKHDMHMIFEYFKA